MNKEINYRRAVISDSLRLSVLYKQVYIQTYGQEGVTDESAKFITNKFSVEKLERTINENQGNIILATYKDNLVGVAEIEFDKQCPLNDIVAPELNKLYILEWFCGMGIGKRLMQEAEREVRSKGIKEMWLWALASNTRAITFYEKQNYEWIGNADFQIDDNYYDNKVMYKKL